MNYSIDQSGRELTIRISELSGEQQELLKAFQGCQEGHCKCPTKEYTKLENMDVQVDPDRMELRMKAKEGMMINQNMVERCLKYTLDEAAKATE